MIRAVKRDKKSKRFLGWVHRGLAFWLLCNMHCLKVGKACDRAMSVHNGQDFSAKVQHCCSSNRYRRRCLVLPGLV